MGGEGGGLPGMVCLGLDVMSCAMGPSPSAKKFAFAIKSPGGVLAF